MAFTQFNLNPRLFFYRSQLRLCLTCELSCPGIRNCPVDPLILRDPERERIRARKDGELAVLLPFQYSRQNASLQLVDHPNRKRSRAGALCDDKRYSEAIWHAAGDRDIDLVHANLVGSQAIVKNWKIKAS